MADTDPVVNRLLVLTAFVCCALVALSFTMFALDQISGASKQQQNALVAGQTGATPVAPASPRHGQPRRFIDDAANALTSPFRSIIPSTSDWVMHGSETLFALLVYGLGLGYLARFTRGIA